MSIYDTPENPALDPDWNPGADRAARYQRDQDNADADRERMIDEGYMDADIHDPTTPAPEAKPYPGDLLADCKAVEPTEWQRDCDILQGLL